MQVLFFCFFFQKGNQECHIKWMPVFTACESKFKILIYQQVWENFDGLLDHFLISSRIFSNLGFKHEKTANQVPTNSKTLKNHHFNGHTFILFLSVINRMIMAGSVVIVTVSRSTGADRGYFIKSFLISSCFSLSLILFSQYCSWHYLSEECVLSFSILIRTVVLWMY